MPILSRPSSTAVEGCGRPPCLHSTRIWWILHALPTAPCSAQHCPATQARCFTQKTLSQISGWSYQNATCCMAMNTTSPWPASLIPAHGATSLTWWARCTWPLLQSNRDSSITETAAATMLWMSATPAWKQPQQKRLVVMIKCQVNRIPARAPRSTRANGRLALDTTSASGKSFTTWMAMAVAARRHFSSAIMLGTMSWLPSGPVWRLAWTRWRWCECCVPVSGLAGWEDSAAGPGQHTPHDSIPNQAGSGREPLRALRPCR